MSGDQELRNSKAPIYVRDCVEGGPLPLGGPLSTALPKPRGAATPAPAQTPAAGSTLYMFGAQD